MVKRVKILLAVAFMAMVGVIVWQLVQPREPEPVYRERTLTSWLRDYPQQANEAVRQIGSNAIPTLLRLLLKRDSATKLKLMNLVQRQHIIKFDSTLAEVWNNAAEKGFQVLGAQAESAVPSLIEIASQNTFYRSRAYAIQALGNIGPPAKRAIPSLLLRWAAKADTAIERYEARNALLRIDPGDAAKAGITVLLEAPTLSP